MASDSLECRNCNDYESMDLTRLGARAAGIHKRWLGNGQKTCIDCHKGVAHGLPDMSGVPQG
jgi:cytochrome c-type protein NapC